MAKPANSDSESGCACDGSLASPTRTGSFNTIIERYLSTSNNKFTVDQIAQRLANECQPKDEPLISEIATACHCELESYSPLTSTEDNNHLIALNSLHYCAVFYENIGAPKSFLAIALEALNYARDINNDCLLRRAHSTVGHAYTRVCKFEDAFRHMKISYEIAIKQNDVVAMLIVLGNVVSILEGLGLFTDARNLSSNIVHDRSSRNDRIDCIRFVSATNGMRISNSLGDYSSAELFYRQAKQYSRPKSPYISELNWATFNNACVTHLLLMGDMRKANNIMKQALLDAEGSQNLRIEVLSVCSQAEYFIATGDAKKVTDLKRRLEHFILDALDVSDVYEDVLQSLLRISLFFGGQQNTFYQNRTDEYLEYLQIHSIGVKHLAFYQQYVSKEVMSDFIGPLEGPWYELPEWLEKLCATNDNSSKSKISCHRNHVLGKQKKTPFDIFENTRRERWGIRSSASDVAEKWAVAIEYALGGDGGNCFRSSRLAGQIARELGQDDKKTSEIELACRLRDVGYLFVAFSHPKLEDLKVSGKFSLLSRHPIVGNELLTKPGDKSLELAASIALTHHEWWNGCGYPAGLSRLQIPIEGRICAVADFFVSLAFPLGDKLAWPVSSIVKQIQTMAGVQFDPSVCAVISQAADQWEAKQGDKVSDRSQFRKDCLIEN